MKGLQRLEQLLVKRKLFWWESGIRKNVGDDISPMVMQYVLSKNGINYFTGFPSKRTLGIGSIMHFAKDGDCIWGTGVNGKIDNTKHHFKNLDVRAVRGPLTRSFLVSRGLDVPEVFGDPAILMPRVYMPNVVSDSLRKVLFIPHYNHEFYFQSCDVETVKTDAALPDFVSKIIASRGVVSSSLHGIILAEAYGRPAVWFSPEGTTEPDFKFLDYYAGTGRYSVECEVEFEQALNKLESYQDVPDLTCLQDNLEKNFPLDLWERF